MHNDNDDMMISKVTQSHLTWLLATTALNHPVLNNRSIVLDAPCRYENKMQVNDVKIMLHHEALPLFLNNCCL